MRCLASRFPLFQKGRYAVEFLWKRLAGAAVQLQPSLLYFGGGTRYSLRGPVTIVKIPVFGSKET